MKKHQGVINALNSAQYERRCATGDTSAISQAMRRRVRSGEIVSPYPNLFAHSEYWSTLDPNEKSLHVIRSLSRIHPQWVFAGISAVCAYGYEHSHAMHDGNVFIATTRGASDYDHKSLRRVQMSRIERWRVQGLPVTSPARTLIDCAALPFIHALAIYDSALRAGHVRKQEILALGLQSNRNETAVRRLITCADAASENGGESMARGRMEQCGLAKPLLQIEFDNPNNPDMPYRVDFCWKLHDGRIIVAEYDGMAKYADARNSSRASMKAKLEYERHREQHLRSQSVTEIVHLFYEDVMNPDRLEVKLVAAGVPKVR